ncbi:hypothetical protein MUP77_00650, partial [Candidatus Bathyarchaeota archaeon]|nr:hypothetical protein [Candidatus Bathyarchaeota archaeon]
LDIGQLGDIWGKPSEVKDWDGYLSAGGHVAKPGIRDEYRRKPHVLNRCFGNHSTSPKNIALSRSYLPHDRAIFFASHWQASSDG